MNTTKAQSIPDAAELSGFEVKRELWRLPIGEVFEDWSGKQRFEKVAEIINSRGEARHAILCLASPFREGQKLRPICSAFFTAPGTLLFRDGSLKVFVRPEPKENIMQKESKPLTAKITLGGFQFQCSEIRDGVAINPELPANFSSTANETRPPRHRQWWDVPYIEVYHDDHPQFVQHWKGNTRYDVRCLDGGAWDRPTCWGMFSTLEEALACCGKGPSWLQRDAGGRMMKTAEMVARLRDMASQILSPPDSKGKRLFEAIATELEQLQVALEESVKLQSHYAELLNMHDGGQRMGFGTGEAWIKRLQETKTLPVPKL